MKQQKYDYRRLNAYMLAKDLVIQAYCLINQFPQYEQYALCDQLRRAIISVPSNIAEGLGRFSDKEKVHFLEIAYASLMESQCQFDLARSLGYITQDNQDELDEKITNVAQLISGLRAKYVNNQKITQEQQ